VEAFPELPAETSSTSRPSSRDWCLIGAAASLLGSWLTIAVGGLLDVLPLLYVGVVGMYLGVGWVVPGTLVGVAVKQSAESRGARHPTRVAVATGIGVGFAALVMSSAILAAVGAGDLAETTETDNRVPTLGIATEADDRGAAVRTQDEKIALVAATARLRSSRHGGVSYVVCQKTGDFCVVSYGALTCQLWRLEHLNGVDVAQPIGLRMNGHGMYDEDHPESVACSSES
jgi:hypothetical protein